MLASTERIASRASTKAGSLGSKEITPEASTVLKPSSSAGICVGVASGITAVEEARRCGRERGAAATCPTQKQPTSNTAPSVVLAQASRSARSSAQTLMYSPVVQRLYPDLSSLIVGQSARCSLRYTGVGLRLALTTHPDG